VNAGSGQAADSKPAAQALWDYLVAQKKPPAPVT
jgi:hypothetical protein